MMLSSLWSSQNCFSSRGLVKISANWSLVHTCEIAISSFMVLSLKKMVLHVYVFGSRVLTRVVSNLDDTLIVT
jgi:hypothetical protein